MNDGFAFACQGLRGVVGESARVGEASRDVFVVVELRGVLRGRDNGDLPVETAGGLADIDQLDAVGAGCDFVEIVSRFVVVGEVEIVARFVTEYGFGCGDGLGIKKSETEACQEHAAGEHSRMIAPFRVLSSMF